MLWGWKGLVQHSLDLLGVIERTLIRCARHGFKAGDSKKLPSIRLKPVSVPYLRPLNQ